MANKIYTAIGLMSGTSLDGIDAALLRSDGHGVVERIGFYTTSYPPKLREALRACLGLTHDVDGRVAAAEREMTLAHARAVASLREEYPMEVDLVGFHGQTIHHNPIHHDPSQRVTWQIGDGALLAAETGIDVICDFRSADVAAGGQGAPLLPLYHGAVTDTLPKPLAILNIGGVANVTFIGSDGELLAFDTGPGGALLDDWVKNHGVGDYDRDGMLAAQGSVDETVLQAFSSDAYFSRRAPKSLDRDQWSMDMVKELSLEDGAATLTAMSVHGVIRALEQMPEKPLSWYVTGGGRLNPVMMEGLRKNLGVRVGQVDELGLDGDAMEAEGFAYLAIRSALGLPLSLPTTTNVPHPVKGGRRWQA